MKRLFAGIFAVGLFALSAHADWTRDILIPTNLADYPTPRTLDRGAIVADLVPTAAWPGKEVVQASHDRIYILRADNGAPPLELVIPELYCPVPDQTYTPHRLWLEDIPAVGDVNDDGYPDIVASIRTTEVWATGQGLWYYSYAAVVWWIWNPQTAGFDQYHRYDCDTYLNTDAFGIPTICRTGWTGGAPTVLFYGRHMYRPFNESRVFRTTAFDLRDPQNPQRITVHHNVYPTMSFERFAWPGEEQYTVAAGDLNGDGYDELVTNDSQFIWCHEWNGTTWAERFRYDIRWFPYGNYKFASGGITLADVDADGQLEVLAAATLFTPPNTWNNMRVLQVSSSGALELAFGQSEFPPNPYEEYHPVPAVANLSPWFLDYQVSGSLNPLFMTDNDTRMYYPDGSILRPTGWPFRHHNPMFSSEHVGVALADVYGLDRPQIIFSGKDAAGPSSYKLYDFMNVLAPLAQVTLPDVPTWSSSNVSHRGVPAIADVDQDGLAEMVMVVRHHEAAETHAHYKVMVKDLNVPYNRELVYWSQFQNSPQNTGLYAQPVTGNQPRADVKWSGRIVVYGTYQVNAGQTLTIEQGTVVEFRPGAALQILGNLYAEGTATDSIYFKPDGTSPWGNISLLNVGDAHFSHCVLRKGGVYVNGGADVRIRFSHIHSTDVGIDATKANALALIVEGNRIHDCTYGVRGTISAGWFDRNTIRGCKRAGVYWVGDHLSGAAAMFQNNTIMENGIGQTNAIAGAYFSNTTARLLCNDIQRNMIYQIQCELYANIVMNENGQRSAGNYVADVSSALWCGQCGSPMPGNFKPLVWLNKSWPALSYGYNTFHFDIDGTYFFDISEQCNPVQIHAMKSNHYEPDNNPPAPGNLHFCPTDRYYDPSPDLLGTECGVQGSVGLEGSFAAFAAAAQAEEEGEFTQASQAYLAVIEDFPATIEAVWSARGFLRASLAAGSRTRSTHDSLSALSTNESLPLASRSAAQREAVWALVAGEQYADARSDLQDIFADPAAGEDSLWAAVMLELIAFLEENRGGGLDSPGPSAAASVERVASLHSRIHELLGRSTDEEARQADQAKPASPALVTAYPNPFNATVTIRLDLPEALHARLEIYNLLGQKVATLADKLTPAGVSTFLWDASQASSGVYIYRLAAGTHIESHKMLLLK